MSNAAKFFIALLLVVAGAAAGLIVVNATKDDSGGGGSTATGATTAATTAATTTVTVQKTAPESTTVTTAANETVTVKIDEVDSTYCKTYPQVCAAISDEVVSYLSATQQTLIAEAKRVCDTQPDRCGGITGKNSGNLPPKPSSSGSAPKRGAPQPPSGGPSGGVSSP